MQIPVNYDSLLLGLLVASILGWMIWRVRNFLQQLKARPDTSKRAAGAPEQQSVAVQHRREVLRRAQASHLAAPLFSLDEILVEPSLLAPPARVEPDGPVAREDVVTLTVPYMPAWPELAAAYDAPELTLTQALEGGAQLLLIGQPGTGKTVALAHLATLAANRDEALGSLRDRVPFFLHASELRLPVAGPQDCLDLVAELTSAALPSFRSAKVQNWVFSSFRSGNALLMLDGFDELTRDGQKPVIEFLRLIIGDFPHVRIVVTGAPEHLGDILALGFVPVSVSAWNRRRRGLFLGRWTDLWVRTVGLENSSRNGSAAVEATLLRCWLEADGQDATPLELTLKAWTACAGDFLGQGNLAAVESHIRRLAPGDTALEVLDDLAMKAILAAQPFFDAPTVRKWMEKSDLAGESTFAHSDAPIESADEPGGKPAGSSTKSRPVIATSVPGLLSDLTRTGLIAAVSEGRMRFLHPCLAAYLAARAFSRSGPSDTLINQPDWIGKLLTMRYHAARAEAQGLVDLMLSWSRLPMHRPMLTAARWLRDAPTTARWRGRLLEALGQLVQTPGLPVSLRCQAVIALVESRDPGVGLLFRQLLGSPSPEVRQMAALGAGALGDAAAIPLLKAALLTPGISSRRAACLALVAIGSTPALEAVGAALLRGDDEMRRAAAEALANDRGEGHAMLKDAATMPDILLRRAAAYGLGRIPDTWAGDLLDGMRLEDEQWIVRNAAGEMIEARVATVDARAPRPLVPPSESAWLIRFAGARGMGVSPGAPATPILLEALKSMQSDERLAAVEYLKGFPTEGVVKELYAAMYGSDSELREAAFMALWEIAASGRKLPDPTKYGLN